MYYKRRWRHNFADSQRYSEWLGESGQQFARRDRDHGSDIEIFAAAVRESQLGAAKLFESSAEQQGELQSGL